MYSIIFWVIMLIMIPTTNLFSQETGDETVFSEVETAPTIVENLDAGKVFGKILFFPELTPRPTHDRHKVQVGEVVPICLQLNSQDAPFLSSLKEKTIGFKLILEDDSEPPQVINITVGNLFELIQPDQQGCFNANYKVPAKTKSGIYQVANLFWVTKENHFYSLRNQLYQFSQADELQVENPDEDKEPPQLIKITTKQKEVEGLKRSFAVLKADLDEKFYFHEDKSDVVWDSLKINYKLFVDQKLKKTQTANCKINKKKQTAQCRIESINPAYEWALNVISYRLDTIMLQDKAGNLLKVDDPQILKEKSGESPIEFQFKLQKPLSEKFKKKQGQIPN